MTVVWQDVSNVYDSYRKWTVKNYAKTAVERKFFFFFQKRFDTKIKLSVKLMAKGYAGFPQTSKM